jgi:hypothetical protein
MDSWRPNLHNLVVFFCSRNQRVQDTGSCSFTVWRWEFLSCFPTAWKGIKVTKGTPLESYTCQEGVVSVFYYWFMHWGYCHHLFMVSCNAICLCCRVKGISTAYCPVVDVPVGFCVMSLLLFHYKVMVGFQVFVSDLHYQWCIVCKYECVEGFSFCTYLGIVC